MLGNLAQYHDVAEKLAQDKHVFEIAATLLGKSRFFQFLSVMLSCDHHSIRSVFHHAIKSDTHAHNFYIF